MRRGCRQHIVLRTKGKHGVAAVALDHEGVCVNGDQVLLFARWREALDSESVVSGCRVRFADFVARCPEAPRVHDSFVVVFG